jgi:hypothetical protein
VYKIYNVAAARIIECKLAGRRLETHDLAHTHVQVVTPNQAAGVSALPSLRSETRSTSSFQVARVITSSPYQPPTALSQKRRATLSARHK